MFCVNWEVILIDTSDNNLCYTNTCIGPTLYIVLQTTVQADDDDDLALPVWGITLITIGCVLLLLFVIILIICIVKRYVVI